MIRFASALFFAAWLAVAPVAAQDARDFQLPPAATPSADPRVQGPVDSDAPVPVRPRAIEAARTAPPTPSQTQAPAPIAAAGTGAVTAPAIVLPTGASPRPAAPGASPRTAPSSTPTEAVPIPPAYAPDAPSSLTLPSPSRAAVAAPPANTKGVPPPPVPWPWIAIAAAISAAGAAAFAFRRLRHRQVDVPRIVAHAAADVPPGEALTIAVEATRMDRSVMAATVGYRVTVRNRTSQALNGVSVEADLTSASRERPTEQQLASPDQSLTPRHTTERLAPGQSLRFEGQVRLPLSEASAVWQGRAALLVPLLRVRATAIGALPVATTLVLGRSEGQAARPQPFRLDEPPRSYAPLAQRVLDGVPARA